MVIMNANDKAQDLQTKRFTERTGAFTKGVDIITGKEQFITDTIAVPAFTTLVLELK
jgi:hypothetical protein